MLAEEVIALNFAGIFTSIELTLNNLLNEEKYGRCKRVVKNISAQINKLKFEVNRRNEALQKAKQLLHEQSKGYIFCYDTSNIDFDNLEATDIKNILKSNADYILNIIENIENNSHKELN